MAIADDRVTLDWLILCDSAHVVNNKLYMLGGGWEILTVNSGFPVEQPFAVAAAYKIPWAATNHRHAFEVRILNEDTNEVVAAIAGEFEVGRPPGIPPGSAQRTQLAAEFKGKFNGDGLYVIRCNINGEEHPGRQVAFRVIRGPLLALKEGPPRGSGAQGTA